jgi:hypothetical protein
LYARKNKAGAASKKGLLPGKTGLPFTPTVLPFPNLLTFEKQKRILREKRRLAGMGRSKAARQGLFCQPM